MFHYINKRSITRKSPHEIEHLSKDSLDFVQRLSLWQTMDVHNGCVNTVVWNESGNYLLSGSDDRHIVISDPFHNKDITKIYTAHRSNIFSAKFLPFSSDKKIISCAGDGKIIFTDLDKIPETKNCIFDCHRSSVYDVVTVPNDGSCFLSCGEDTTVRWFDLRDSNMCPKDKCNKNIMLQMGKAATAIALNPVKPYEIAIGTQDSVIRVYDRRKIMNIRSSDLGWQAVLMRMRPDSLKGRQLRITCLRYDELGLQILASYSAAHLYLFDTLTCKTEKLNFFKERKEKDSVQAALKRLRFRGDWSDTGPNARPERMPNVPSGVNPNPSTFGQARPILQNSLMSRMSNMLSRMLSSNPPPSSQPTPPPPMPGALPNPIPFRGPSPPQDIIAGPSNAPHVLREPPTSAQESPPTFSTPSYDGVTPSASGLTVTSATPDSDALRDGGDFVVPSSSEVPPPPDTPAEGATASPSPAEGATATPPAAEGATATPPAAEGVSAPPSAAESATEGTAGITTALSDVVTYSAAETNRSCGVSSMQCSPVTVSVQCTEPIVSTLQCSVTDSGSTSAVPSVSQSLEGASVPPMGDAPYLERDVSMESETSSALPSNQNEGASTATNPSPDFALPSSSRSTSTLPSTYDSSTLSSSYTLADTSSQSSSSTSFNPSSAPVPSRRRSEDLYDDQSYSDDLSSDDDSSQYLSPPLSPPNVAGSSVLRDSVRKKVKTKIRLDGPYGSDMNTATHIKTYSGHRNSRTMIKEACFWGRDYIMSGSDCGRIFVWNRHTQKLVMLMEADRRVVNCLQPHPSLPILASSGIDYNIKLWSPIAEEISFDEARADEIMQCNEVLLEETQGTITVPATFMLRILMGLNHLRRPRGDDEGNPEGDHPEEGDVPVVHHSSSSDDDDEIL